GTGRLSKEAGRDASPVWFTKTDDYFYHAQGVVHALHHLAAAIEREYANDFASRPAITQLLHEVADGLGHAGAGRLRSGARLQAAGGAGRQSGERVRESPEEPGRVDRRRAPEDLLD